MDTSLDASEMRNLICKVWDISLYVECIRKLIEINHNMVVLCGVKDTPGGQGALEVVKQMHRLGLSNFRFGYGIMYAGIICNGKVVRDLSGEKVRDPITTEYRIDNRVFELESHGYLPAKNYCSIRVNAVEHAINKRGINIVLYDMDNDEVVDSICYDSHLREEKYFSRKDKTLKCT